MGFFSRRRSFLIKLIVIVSTAWFTVAFLLYSERQPIPSVHIEENAPVPAALKQLENKVENIPQRELQPVVEIRDNALDSDKEKENDKEKDIEKFVGEKVIEEQHGPKEDQQGVLAIPLSSYGENGKPVILPTNMTADIKKIIDEGWSKNAFNQYVSDMISVRRTLPDPRDEW